MNRYSNHALIPNVYGHGLTHFDLANWGIEDVAYVKLLDHFVPQEVLDQDGNAQSTADTVDTYGIFAADGTELAQVGGRANAFSTIRQNDLEALSVH